jgi:hypothetical protein
MLLLRPRLLRALPLAAAVLTLLASSLPAQAQWMWRDASGRITVSDLPPPRETPDKDILRRPEAPRRSAAAVAAAPAAEAASRPATAPPAPTDASLEARQRAAEQEQQARQRAEEQKVAAQKSDNCRRAREQMRLLDQGTRLVRINEKGERIVMDDAARAEEARRAREVMASDCR